MALRYGQYYQNCIDFISMATHNVFYLDWCSFEDLIFLLSSSLYFIRLGIYFVDVYVREFNS